MKLTLAAGLLLTLIAAGVAYRVWDERSALAAGAFGALATMIQLAALALVRPVRGSSPARFVTRWGAGMGLRLLGVAAIALAAGLDRRDFPPLPVALGFLGVLFPLLFVEVRAIR